MSYPFPDDLQHMLSEQMSSGQYESVDDVLRDALHALRQRTDDFAAIAQDIEDMNAGRYRSVDEVDADLRRRFNLPSGMCK